MSTGASESRRILGPVTTTPIRAQRPTTPARTKPFPNEKALATACNARIRNDWAGAVLNVHGGGTSQVTGHPDCLGCIRGRMVAVEYKQPGKTPTPLQYKRLREWRDAGALAGWVTTVAELDELLSHVDDPDWENDQLTRDAP